jgi:7-keto-8-aminopelargonate synthetase-like enzyme
VLESEPQWIERLWENARYMHAGFKRLGFNTGNSQTPIIPIIIGDDFRTIGLWMGLWEEGVYTNPVLEPAVSPGRQCLRTSYMATHTRDQLEKVLQAFEVVGKRTGIIS